MTAKTTVQQETMKPGQGGAMKAITRSEYGSPLNVLELKDVDMPVIKDDDVLVRVHAASVNAADPAQVRGKPYLIRPVYGMRRPKRPFVGQDVAGTVDRVGAKVTRFGPGDEVFGGGVGTFAEYAAAPEKRLALKPAGLSFDEAAVLPVAGLTALQGIRDAAGVEEGDKVLINGASGGVGIFAVQVAKALGAEVTAVCSTRNVEQARSIGADQVIDYTKRRLHQRCREIRRRIRQCREPFACRHPQRPDRQGSPDPQRRHAGQQMAGQRSPDARSSSLIGTQPQAREALRSSVESRRPHRPR